MSPHFYICCNRNSSEICWWQLGRVTRWL